MQHDGSRDKGPPEQLVIETDAQGTLGVLMGVGGVDYKGQQFGHHIPYLPPPLLEPKSSQEQSLLFFMSLSSFLLSAVMLLTVMN